jgi:hypothetical protein
MNLFKRRNESKQLTNFFTNLSSKLNDDNSNQSDTNNFFNKNNFGMNKSYYFTNLGIPKIFKGNNKKEKDEIKTFVGSIENVHSSDLNKFTTEELEQKAREYIIKENILNGIQNSFVGNEKTIREELYTKIKIYKDKLKEELLTRNEKKDLTIDPENIGPDIKNINETADDKRFIVNSIDKGINYYIFNKDSLRFENIGQYQNSIIEKEYDKSKNSDFMVKHTFVDRSHYTYLPSYADFYIKNLQTPNGGGKRKSKKSHTIRKVRHNRRKNRKTIVKKRKN